MSATNSSNGGPLKKRPGAPVRTLVFTSVALGLALFLSAGPSFGQSAAVTTRGPKPSDVPAEWKSWLGDYGPNSALFTVGEDHGHLFVTAKLFRTCVLSGPLNDRVRGQCGTARTPVSLEKDSAGHLELKVDQVSFQKRPYGVDPQNVARITPVRPLDELRREALAAVPPEEKGPFRKTDLVELAPLDPAIHLDIRYASSDDFLGAPVYTEARAFLQRPAAEALVRALHRLQPHGYGLLIHDAYRPWYVTKIFWDATPQEGKIFVADPAQGSRHNRGCAVDLTLYDLKTGKPIEMTGAYDEMSPRSHPTYPGGTSLERWHRDLLRWAMESEGFAVYEYEWWHFDYKDWREYAIGNIPFEKLDAFKN